MKGMQTVVDWLNKLPKPWLHALGGSLVLAIGLLDMLTGYESDAPILYLLPILLLAWFSSGVSVAFISAFCTMTWFAHDVISGNIYGGTAFSLFYSLVVFSVFLLVGYSLVVVKKMTAGKSGQKHP